MVKNKTRVPSLQSFSLLVLMEMSVNISSPVVAFSSFISIPSSDRPPLLSTLRGCLYVLWLSCMPYMCHISGDLHIIIEGQITITWSGGGWAQPASLLNDRPPFLLPPDALWKWPTCSPPIVVVLLSAPRSLSSQHLRCMCLWVDVWVGEHLSWTAMTADILREAREGVSTGDTGMESQREG